MASTLTKPRDSLYERDFYAWTQQQAEKLRARSHNDIEWESVAEEIESLGRSDKREIGNRIGVVLLHLLKWEHQPHKRKPGWLNTLREQRHQLDTLLRESPSLRALPSHAVADEFPFARLKASDETGLPLRLFPAQCPYDADEVLSQDFFPGPPWSTGELHED